jgi:tetratricopeptide (TPR) repeat protein/TolB-like protein
MEIWAAEIKELEKLYESIKGQFPELEKELGHLIRAEDENVIMLYSRRCLEVIITNLCECELKRPRKTEPLKGIIDKLHKEEKVPSHIIASMHGLNELSTYGAHPKDFDPEQVKPVLVNLDIIIKWYLKYKGSDVFHKDESESEKDSLKQTGTPAATIPKPKKNLTLILTSILLIIAVIVFPKIFRSNSLENLRSSGERISVAVMPFQNMSNDTTWNVWQSGIQDMLITSLSNSSEELTVRQTGSINNLIRSKSPVNYASITPSFASSISQKLDANVFIYGNIKQAGPIVRVYAQLIDSKTEEVFKSFEVEDSAKEENIFSIIDSLSLMVKNFLIMSKLIKEGNPATVKFEATTKNPEAFKLVISGNNSFFGKSDFPTAIELYSKALAIDSSYLYPAIMISYSYWNQHLYDEGKKWCLKVYDKKDQLPELIKINANIVHAMYFETPYESINFSRQLLKIDDKLPDVYTDIGYDYNRLNQYSKAIPELEKALEIYEKWGIKPLWSTNYASLGVAYLHTGQYEKVKKLYRKAEEYFPYDLLLSYYQCLFTLTEGDSVNYDKYLEKAIRIARENSWTDADIAAKMGEGYSEIGKNDMAEESYRKALSLEPEEPARMNDLAYLLIDSERNVPEGLQLADKALGSDPENYKYLDCKGWGLYKQGKYKEALELLERSWELKPVYKHEIFLHLEAAKKAIDLLHSTV